MQEMKASEAIAQGYTRFRMGKIDDMAEKFICIPLTLENIEHYTRRGSDEKFDNECAEKEDDDIVFAEYFFGTYPILCEKARYPSVSSEDLIEWLVEKHEDDDELVPASIQFMAESMGEEEDFKKGLELINKAMAEYKSYTDTDIKVVVG